MSALSDRPAGRTSDSTYSLDLCPRCEEGVLSNVEAPYDITVAGSTVRIPKVQVEQCKVCGFRALSGREVRLFEVLFAPHYHSIGELIDALRAARYYGMFLREDEAESSFGFGTRDYVDTLKDDLRELYLDNEANHVLGGLNAVSGSVSLDVAGHRYVVKLPKIGEGENGVVYDYEEDPGAVLKVAKPRAYSRDHIRKECEVTEFYDRHGIPVPRIVDADRYGNYAIKERLAGQALAVIYDELGPPDSPRHQRVRAAVQAFIDKLLDLFVRHPEVKTSVSPNNIFVVENGEGARALLVDTGPAPFHDYSKFSFAEYWDVTIPQKIKQYRAVGYI
jgi:hypothetical protein